MGCRILFDDSHYEDSLVTMACLYCSTTDVAFGPVFSGDPEHDHDARERAEAFLRWLDVTPAWSTLERHSYVRQGQRDPRELTDVGLQTAYAIWLKQEQWAREDRAERQKWADEDDPPEAA